MDAPMNLKIRHALSALLQGHSLPTDVVSEVSPKGQPSLFVFGDGERFYSLPTRPYQYLTAIAPGSTEAAAYLLQHRPYALVTSTANLADYYRCSRLRKKRQGGVK
jgi:hypothetical protein